MCPEAVWLCAISPFVLLTHIKEALSSSSTLGNNYRTLRVVVGPIGTMTARCCDVLQLDVEKAQQLNHCKVSKPQHI